ncbi:hypothetical protein A0H81_07998 [Grifola frondosa]|uniref:Uncharacterized protein n=1 Tax=Grifola frondosa TaxID=5627 RepID=A0A1C7M685_GRIFR|nr:hypothetical protein A0H81_07998 [Grifola frondosa]
MCTTFSDSSDVKSSVLFFITGRLFKASSNIVVYHALFGLPVLVVSIGSYIWKDQDIRCLLLVALDNARAICLSFKNRHIQ